MHYAGMPLTTLGAARKLLFFPLGKTSLHGVGDFHSYPARQGRGGAPSLALTPPAPLLFHIQDEQGEGCLNHKYAPALKQIN